MKSTKKWAACLLVVATWATATRWHKSKIRSGLALPSLERMP